MVIFILLAKEAHAYRAGIIGCLTFGACGVHVPCCMAVYLLKRFYGGNVDTVMTEVGSFLIWFLMPATVIFLIFFFLTAIVQIKAFANRHTPFPKWCLIFNILFGVVWIVIMRVIGDHALANALAAAWISVANLWMLGGLLIVSSKK